ncbi:OmpA family protein [Henriciella sp. AS95]|uniref:OmpA/MotB family protein n=1 Tax=Henriciella sp. AS95 TaxID=3135782 RepID=UPI00317D4DFE
MPLAPVRRQGAWKLAYADFLTALCAFFLVMWLIHGASNDQRADIAGQFSSSSKLEPHLTTVTEPESNLILEQLYASSLLQQHRDNVFVQANDGGIRVELIDLERMPLFNKGEATLNDRGTLVINLAAKAIAGLGLPVAIEGHTDSAPMLRAGYSNWELSSDRANAARRALLAGGVDASQIRSVSGLADTRPLEDGRADLPQNRRLSIVIQIE